MSLPTLLCLSGPTAAGKTAAALALARRWPVEIICMDSATIYRGMDIGTAKPDASERAVAPHHLLDIRDPAEAYSAADFLRDAQALVNDITARGRLPLLCGGTLLYYHALRVGLAELPEADASVRADLDAQAAATGWPALHEELRQVDPATAARLAPNDRQRVQRALEIYRVSGKPMSQWLAEAPTQAPAFQHRTISLEPSRRTDLHARIAVRFQSMMEAGLLDEVAALRRRGDLHPDLPSIRSVGYRQLWQHLAGEASLDDAIASGVAATRQLAKRQLTWLRSLPQRHRVDCLDQQAPAQVVDLAAQYWPG